MDIDILNLQGVHLPRAFQYLKSKSIESLHLLFPFRKLDVSSILVDLMPLQ